MKFTSLLKSIIVEQSRFEVLMNALTKPGKDKEGNKTKPKLSAKEFIALVMADPTTRLNNVDVETATPEELGKIKAGSYVPWLVKHYLLPKTETNPGDFNYEKDVKRAKDVFMEDIYKVTDDLKKFERFKGKLPKEMRDINKLTPQELYNAVKDFDLTMATTTKAERKSAPVHPGAELVFDGPNWRVIKIEDKGQLGKEAACFYGGGGQDPKETRWCTAAPGLSWFQRYIDKGPLYVVFNPNDTKIQPVTGLPVERYQFHFPDNMFMDKDDYAVDLIDLLNGRMAELKDFFKPEFAKGVVLGGKELKIDSLSSGPVGKFIALYGMEDLVDNLPLTLETIAIQNRDNKEPIRVELPEDIGRFSNLKNLLTDNVSFSKIPESICQLKQLRFLTVMRNPDLVEIPACVVDIPSLIFLNFKGSDNVQVPKEVEEKGSSIGPNMWDIGN